MPTIHIFAPPHRVAEMAEEIRRYDQLDKQFRSFIDYCFRDFRYKTLGLYEASKLIHDVVRLVDPVQPDKVRVYAARRILSRMGEIIRLWRWTILAPEIAAQSELHKRLLEEEIEHRAVAALFHLLHEQAAMLQEPPEDFYKALRKEIAGQVTTDVLGEGWSRRLVRYTEVIRDPIALHEIGQSILLENLPALDELFSTLSDRQLELMTLHYIDKLPVREIADRCHISVSSVTSQLTKARENLRQHFA